LRDRLIPSSGGTGAKPPKNPAILGFPQDLFVETTNFCNAACVMCPREKLTRPLGEMKRELYERIVDECVRHREFRFLTLFGFGESLLDPGLINRIRYAKGKNVGVVRCSTNAHLLTTEFSKELILSGLDRLKISFYGTNKEEYESVHRRLNFEESSRNIKNLLLLKRRLKKSNPSVSIQYLIDTRRGPAMNAFLSLKFYLQWIRHLRIQYAFLHNFVTGREYNKTVYSGNGMKCQMIYRNRMHVLWNGDVTPCTYDFNGEMVLGNICRASINDIWSGEGYHRFRRAHTVRDFKNYPMCAKCDIWSALR